MNHLRDLPLFSHLQDEVLADLYARLTLRRYRRGQVVIHEGAVGNSMYLIRSGQVEIMSEGLNGRQPGFITHMGPGEYVGELSMLLNTPRSATVRVTIEAELWELRQHDLHENLHPRAKQATTSPSFQLLKSARTYPAKECEDKTLHTMFPDKWKHVERENGKLLGFFTGWLSNNLPP